MFLGDLHDAITGDSKPGDEGKQEPLVLYCDNSAAVQLAENALSGKRVKHAMRRLSYLRELKDRNEMSMLFVPGEDNLADIFTKPLAGPRFHELRVQLIAGDLDSEDGE